MHQARVASWPARQNGTHEDSLANVAANVEAEPNEILPAQIHRHQVALRKS